MKNILGNYLEKKRKECNYSLKKLSEKTNIPFSSISRYERGDSIPPEDKLIKIAKGLDLSNDYVEYLLFLLDLTLTTDRMKQMIFKMMDIKNEYECEIQFFKKRDKMKLGKSLNDFNSDELLDMVLELRFKEAREEGNLDDVLDNFRKLEEKMGDEWHKHHE